MAHEVQVHAAQTSILRELLFADDLGFSVLQKATGLSSDHFKFHLKRLLETGYVEKTMTGHYRLTAPGKEYANKLDTATSTIERQPKSAVILVIEHQLDGQAVLLLQQRQKHPYFGFWGFPGGKIRWGETIVQAAARELAEEASLQAQLTYRGVYHEHVSAAETGLMLEDKIFHVMYGTQVTGTLTPHFEGGHNAWLTLEQARAKDRHYASLDIEAEIGLGRQTFAELTQVYRSDQF